MGTSANRDKLKPDIPLIPDWILPALPDQEAEQENDQEQSENEEQESDSESESDQSNSDEQNNTTDTSNRFLKSQREFRSAVKGRNINRGLITRVLKNYITRAGGGPKTMARRMQRSSWAIARFGEILSNVRNSGLESELRRLNLRQYENRPILDVLSALMDEVCGTGAVLDDAITKQAYANTIVRINDENLGIDLDSLNQNQIAEMLAIFIEETIVYRLICDVGRSLTTATSDVQRSLEIENTLYQVVNGLVHSVIVPQLQNSLQNINELNKEIDSIYEIAFNTIIH